MEVEGRESADGFKLAVYEQLSSLETIEKGRTCLPPLPLGALSEETLRKWASLGPISLLDDGSTSVRREVGPASSLQASAASPNQLPCKCPVGHVSCFSRLSKTG
jgi:hypothetical protein